MKVILFGPPGGGKGTQAALLSEKYAVPILSASNLLREFITMRDCDDAGDADCSDVIERVKCNMREGNFVDDEIVEGLFERKISSNSCNMGFILDGFPRTLNQADFLRHILKREFHDDSVYVIDLVVEEQELRERLIARFTCIECGKSYNDLTMKTKNYGVCDICGGCDFKRRSDDQPDVIQHRVAAYRAQTQPVIRYYMNSPLYIQINGAQQVDAVFNQIVKFLES